MSAGTTRAGLRRLAVPAALISLAAGLGSVVAAPHAALASSQGASSISAGDAQSCAIERGKAYCWGDNELGELGDGSTASSSVPVAVDTRGVLAGKTLTQITTSGGHTCALDHVGAAYCWGRNDNGQLGDGSTADSSVPVAVDTYGVMAGQALTRITAGVWHTCALDRAGAAYCWGWDQYGQLGDGSTADSSVPVAVDTSGALAGKTLTQITVGLVHTCALDSTGAAYCWGDSSYGELGDRSNTGSSVPVAVDTSGALADKTLTQITAGWLHVCALDSTGAVYCWGYNAYGELGDGSIGFSTNSSVPVAVDTSGVLAGKTLTQITAGSVHTCALDTAGAAYCWGFNAYGGLGAGTTAGSSVAVAVDTSGALAGKTLTQITAGVWHTCALDTAGAAYCWGWNGDGELGDDATTQSTVPVLLSPQAPPSVTATAGNATATASWEAPVFLNGGTLTGYTATAFPGGAACTTTGATTCIISGLANGTTYNISVVAHTTAGDSGASLPVTAAPPGGEPVFTSGSADTAAFGRAFTFTVTTTGDPAPTITRTGRLPSGVRFADNSDGTATISGTPAHAAAGAYPLTLTARNKNGTASQAFTLTVTRAPAIRKIPTTRARVGVPLKLTVRATGYPSPALAESGPLPAGLKFTDNGNGTALIAGTPAAGSGGGRYPVTITATNVSGTATRHFTILLPQRRRQ